MKILLVFAFIFSATQICTNEQTTHSSLSIDQRIALLKYQIAKEIKKKNSAFEMFQPIDNRDFSAEYEERDDNDPITPIMDFDRRKRREKFKLRELKTTTEALWVAPKIKVARDDKQSVDDARLNQELNKAGTTHMPKTQRKKKHKHAPHDFKDWMHHKKGKKHLRNKNKTSIPEKLSDLFYRRFAVEPNNLQSEVIHCQDLITPFLEGHKVNMSDWKILTYNDHKVVRLIQLIGEDTEDLSRDEIYSIMYQISNIQIRLFQWDLAALKLLFNVINKEHIKRHSFRTIKNGLKRTLGSWKLDFTNTTNLLKQSKLFRPPCIRSSNYEGSTKTSKSVRYTKKVKPKCVNDQIEECY